MTRSTLFTGLALARLAGPYALLRVLTHHVRLETLVRWAWREPSRAPFRRDAQTVAAHARALSRLCGASRDCLPRSLLLYRELSRRGADPRLRIGFLRAGAALVGHAWIVLNGEPLGEPRDLVASLVPICEFGPRGRVRADGL